MRDSGYRSRTGNTFGAYSNLSTLGGLVERRLLIVIIPVAGPAALAILGKAQAPTSGHSLGLFHDFPSLSQGQLRLFR